MSEPIPKKLLYMQANAMIGTANAGEIDAVRAYYRANGLTLPKGMPPESESDGENENPEGGDVVQKIYTHIVKNRHVVSCLGSLYMYDQDDGVWDHISPTTIADHTRESMKMIVRPKQAEGVSGMLDVNVGAFNEVNQMNVVRGIPTNYGLLDFHNKRTIPIEQAKELYVTRWGKPLSLSWDPRIPLDQALNPTATIIRNYEHVDVWDYILDRYGVEYLIKLSILLFGRVRKEILWGFHPLSDYGKTTLIQIIADALPGCVAILDGRELTGEGSKWTGAEIEMASRLIVCIDEADKVTTIKGRINSLTAISFNTNPKYGRRFRSNRMGNLIMVGGGTINTEVDVQGVQNRTRHVHRFPLETDILGEVAQLIGDEVVGRIIVSGLSMMAWNHNHDVTMEGTTAEAEHAFDLARSELRVALEDIVVREEGTHTWSRESIMEILVTHDPDVAQLYADVYYTDEGEPKMRTKSRLANAVSQELKAMGFINKMRTSNPRMRAYADLAVHPLYAPAFVGVRPTGVVDGV